jgi:hypothetical protein
VLKSTLSYIKKRKREKNMKKHYDITFKTARKVRKVLEEKELQNYIANTKSHILDVYDVADKKYVYSE